MRGVLPEAEMHHQQERPLPEALSQGRVHRPRQGIHADRALPEGGKEAQGVDEPLFAEGKLWHRMGRFRTRTLKKVNAEALMTATGQNVKRLLAFGGRGPKKLAQAAALRPPARAQFDPTHRRSCDHRRERRVEPTFFNTLERF